MLSYLTDPVFLHLQKPFNPGVIWRLWPPPLCTVQAMKEQELVASQAQLTKEEVIFVIIFVVVVVIIVVVIIVVVTVRKKWFCQTRMMNDEF